MLYKSPASILMIPLASHKGSISIKVNGIRMGAMQEGRRPLTEGKAISKMNALKTSPELHKLMKDYKMLMEQQKELREIVQQ